MKFRELEKLIIADGWELKHIVGSHNQYTHPVKKERSQFPIIAAMFQRQLLILF